MRKFYIENAEKYLHQNRAEITDCIEGCLLDNLLAYSDKAVIALLETYVNTWTSRYMVLWAKSGTEAAQRIENAFYAREEATA